MRSYYSTILLHCLEGSLGFNHTVEPMTDGADLELVVRYQLEPDVSETLWVMESIMAQGILRPPHWRAIGLTGPAGNLFFYVRKLEGHERACRRSISNQNGTSRIPVKKSIVLMGQKHVLSYPGVGLRANY